MRAEDAPPARQAFIRRALGLFQQPFDFVQQRFNALVPVDHFKTPSDAMPTMSAGGRGKSASIGRQRCKQYW